MSDAVLIWHKLLAMEFHTVLSSLSAAFGDASGVLSIIPLIVDHVIIFNITVPSGPFDRSCQNCLTLCDDVNLRRLPRGWFFTSGIEQGPQNFVTCDDLYDLYLLCWYNHWSSGGCCIISESAFLVWCADRFDGCYKFLLRMVWVFPFSAVACTAGHQ
jgi:hypothetical protein